MGGHGKQKTKQKDEKENLRNETVTESSDKKEHLEVKDETKKKTNDKGSNLFLAVCIIGVSLGILLEIINVQNRHKNGRAKKYWVYSSGFKEEDKNGKTKHVHLVLERSGYELSTNRSWDLLWAHDYPFNAMQPHLYNLKPNQRINHFPGSGYITSKVNLAITDSKYIPKAFKLPLKQKEFLAYANENKGAMFLEKDNEHRHVYLKNVTEINLDSKENFVQEYVSKPFLVDGYKFDIGVYVVVTSFDPLRLYWYKGDVLFRYCTEKYYPFDPLILEKYVIGDDYMPTWKVPSLKRPYLELGLSMKDAFDMYAKSKGKDTATMWDEVNKAIVDIFLKKEHHFVDTLKKYASPDNFFEMMRVDLIVDEDFKVYLLEANMSPNLSSDHYPPNRLLYEQVLYNLFSLVGVSNDVLAIGDSPQSMVSDQKNIAVFGAECNSECEDNCRSLELCYLCKPCMDDKLRRNLLRAHREFLHKGDFRRLFPPPMKQGARTEAEELKDLTKYNKLQYLWYQGKCDLEITWCY